MDLSLFHFKLHTRDTEKKSYPTRERKKTECTKNTRRDMSIFRERTPNVWLVSLGKKKILTSAALSLFRHPKERGVEGEGVEGEGG